MTVKTIFKVLIGTIVIIVVSSAIIEIFNVSTTGLQLNQLSKLAGKQASVLFTQETYKQNTSGTAGAVNMVDIYDSNETVYIEGKFYDSVEPEEIYNKIYTSDDFKNWLKLPEIQQANWYSVKLLNKALNNPYSIENIRFGEPGYDEAMTAKLYKEVMLTPANLGIPYLDKELLTKMFRWNLAQIISNCNQNLIQQDESGNSFVAFKGFRIYADNANIDNIEYKVFDLTNSSDRASFNSITNIDPDKLGFRYDSNLQTTINSLDDERNRVCIVGIQYSIPMTYQGITPISKIFNFIWNNEVEGLKQHSRNTIQQWNSSTTSLQSGGINGNTNVPGVLPVPGKLIYYLIR